MKKAICLLLVSFPLFLSKAQLIDFENLPSGALPTEGMVISNQFWNSHGVQFHYESGAFPRFAKIGGSTAYAFWGVPNHLGADAPATNQNVGSFFLTDGGGVNLLTNGLIIDYRQPVAAASAVILDVDSGEQWLIEARNAQTQTVSSVFVTQTNANAGDGKATPWYLTSPASNIWSIRILAVGTQTSPGWAFDNFAPGLPLAPANLSLAVTQNVAYLSLAGTFGKSYQLQYAAALNATNWQTLSVITLTNAPKAYATDLSASNAPIRFYRAVAN